MESRLHCYWSHIRQHAAPPTHVPLLSSCLHMILLAFLNHYTHKYQILSLSPSVLTDIHIHIQQSQ